MSYLNCKREKGKKNRKCFTKRYKFSNLETPISSEYGPTCLLWNVDQFLYITYEYFKL